MVADAPRLEFGRDVFGCLAHDGQDIASISEIAGILC